jgi:cytoskeletal protein RodZ
MPSPVAAPVMPTAKPKSNKRKIFWIIWIIGGVIAAALAVFVAIFIFVVISSAQQAGVVRDFITDLQTNKASAAYSLTSSEFKNATPVDKFNSFVDQEYKYLPKGSIAIVSEEIGTSSGSSTTTIIANISDTAGKVGYNATTLLTKEDGHWLISSISISAGAANTSSN